VRRSDAGLIGCEPDAILMKQIREGAAMLRRVRAELLTVAAISKWQCRRLADDAGASCSGVQHLDRVFEASWRIQLRISETTRDIVIALKLLMCHRKGSFNSCFFGDNHELRSAVRKLNCLPSKEVFPKPSRRLCEPRLSTQRIFSWTPSHRVVNSFNTKSLMIGGEVVFA